MERIRTAEQALGTDDVYDAHRGLTAGDIPGGSFSTRADDAGGTGRSPQSRPAPAVSTSVPGPSTDAAYGRLSIAYADPPYPGCAHLYRDHPDYAGEVDHAQLVYNLIHQYDGYCLHTSSVALADVIERFRIETNDMPRVMAWVKPFAAFKRNVSVAYAWEPVLVRAARKPVVKPGMTYRDWIAEPITLQRGLTGAKPEAVCRWLFEVMGCEPDDELVDLFPGTGAVAKAWDAWRNQLTIGAA